eukprot:3251850-Rhodomonas_salina.2
MRPVCIVPQKQRENERERERDVTRNPQICQGSLKWPAATFSGHVAPRSTAGASGSRPQGAGRPCQRREAVSYTHLTLPTICSV